MKTQKHLQETRVRLINSKGRPIQFILEPWGEEHDFQPDDEFVLVFRGPSPAEPEVDFDVDSITVYGWTGSTVRVFKNGKDVLEGVPDGLPVPPIP